MLTWRGDKDIGPFEPLLQGYDAPYKSFLHFDQSNAIIAVQRAINDSSNLENELRILFDDLDWRSHLVAGTALLLTKHLDLSDNLWMAFDRGSWVSPQLAGFLYFHDPKFSQTAKIRLENKCSLKFKFWEPVSKEILNELERSQDQYGQYQRSCKAMSSLIWICSTIPSLHKYTSKLATTEEVRQMLNEEANWGDGVVESIQLCFSEAGIKLVQAEK